MLLHPLNTAREAKIGIWQSVRRQHGVLPSTETLVQHKKDNPRIVHMFTRVKSADRHDRPFQTLRTPWNVNCQTIYGVGTPNKAQLGAGHQTTSAQWPALRYKLPDKPRDGNKPRA